MFGMSFQLEYLPLVCLHDRNRSSVDVNQAMRSLSDKSHPPQVYYLLLERRPTESLEL